MTAWNNVADELSGEGIKFESIQKLKQNVTNWIQRATVSIEYSKTSFYIICILLFIFFMSCVTYISHISLYRK